MAGSDAWSAARLDSRPHRPRVLHRPHPAAPGDFDREAPDDMPRTAATATFAVRLGLAAVTRIGATVAERIVAERDAGGVPRHGRPRPPHRAHHRATRGARDRGRVRLASGLQPARGALAGRVGGAGPGRVPRRVGRRRAAAAVRRIRPRSRRSPPISGRPGCRPTTIRSRHFRPRLTERGVLSAAELRTAENGRRIEVAGLVTHRQRPATASGITFLNLEDETGWST